jgi:hypothetical protein
MQTGESKGGDRSRYGRALVLLILCVPPVYACVGARAANPFADVGRREAIVLEVDNRYWADMTISVRRGGSLVRLGLVTTNGRRRFNIPPEASAAGMSVTFVADPVGAQEVYESPLVVPQAGETYVWTLATALAQSSLVRR